LLWVGAERFSVFVMRGLAMERMGQGSEVSEATEPPQAERAGAMSEKDERTWATFCHLAAFAGVLVPYCGNIIGPLVVWLLKRQESAFVDGNGKEAVNFQISMTIYLAVASLLLLALVGFLLLPALIIFGIVCVIMAAVRANDGKEFRYPLCIRFIK